MLVLTRKVRDSVRIGYDVGVTVCEIRGDKVRIGVEAPNGMPIVREELMSIEEVIAVSAARRWVPQRELETVVRRSGITWQKALMMASEVGVRIIPEDEDAAALKG